MQIQLVNVIDFSQVASVQVIIYIMYHEYMMQITLARSW